MQHGNERKSYNMSPHEHNDGNTPADPEANCEIVASWEEIYLEQTEEDLRAILIFATPSSSPGPITTSASSRDDDPCSTECPGDELEAAAEKQVTGVAGDPSLTEEMFIEILNLR
jgi:hypothetical protein